MRFWYVGMGKSCEGGGHLDYCAHVLNSMGAAMASANLWSRTHGCSDSFQLGIGIKEILLMHLTHLELIMFFRIHGRREVSIQIE